MATGKEHDRGIVFTTPAVGALVYWQTQTAAMALIIGGAYLIGGLFLSPDLDLRSNAYYRWSVLRWIWKPYQQLIPHRGTFFNRNPLSHAPILGTVIRVGYLCGVVFGLIWIFDNLAKTAWLDYLWGVFTSDINLLLQILVGIEVAGWTHLVMDVTQSTRSGNFSWRRRRYQRR